MLLLAVIVVWAAHFPLGKLALRELGPLTLTAGRALLAGPMLLLVAWLTAPLRRPLARPDYHAFVVLGLTGLVGNTTVWYWGLAQTTALNAGILGAASPMLVAVAAAAAFGDRLRPLNWLGIALTVAAVLITITKGSLGVLVTLAVNRGDLIILLAQAAWIVYTLYTRAATSTLPAVWIMAGAHTVGALVLVPLAALAEPWRSPGDAPVGWSVVLYGAFLVTLGHLWYYAIVRTIGAGRASAYLNLLPFMVIGLAWALVGEAIRAYHLVGAALVVAGVVLASR